MNLDVTIKIAENTIDPKVELDVYLSHCFYNLTITPNEKTITDLFIAILLYADKLGVKLNESTVKRFTELSQ